MSTRERASARTTAWSAAAARGARYGEFRLDRRSGEAVLVGLRGAALDRL